jgi:carboxypeptidase Q
MQFAHLTAFVASTLGFGADVVPPGTDPSAIQRILDQGKNQNQVMKLLNELTHGIGPRLTGSKKNLEACRWAEKKFKEFGLVNVHLEEWGEMPVSFNRGKRQSAKVVAPYKEDLIFTTPSWTPGTDGPMKGHAVRAPKDEEELEAMRKKLNRAWVLVERGERRGGEASKLDKMLNDAGILGRVTAARGELVTTGGRFTGLEWDKLPTERQIVLQKSAFDKIGKTLDEGKSVELAFDIENQFVKGPTKLYNVVADIPGTEKPDEIVIVCGHLDSWDGPGSLGANDNGTGTVAAIEAARLLMKANAKPKRTIRFILWTGEEQGLLGARAYVDKHKELWPKISAVLNDDGGTNYHGGYQVLESQVPYFQPAIDVVNKAFPDLPSKLQVVPTMPRGGSSDHAAFNMVGIPGFYTIEAGRADYGFVWHTQNDRPEHSIAEYMIQSSTDHAIVSYSLACADAILPREKKASTLFDPELEPARGNTKNYHAHCDHGEDDYLDYLAYVLRWKILEVSRSARVW